MQTDLKSLSRALSRPGAPVSERLLWVFWIRNTVVGVQLLVWFVAHQFLQVVVPWGALLWVVACQLLLNAVLWVANRQVRAGRRPQPSANELFMHIAGDVTAFSLCLYFTGGATNPFVALYLPLLAVAATLLPLGHVLALGLLNVLAYSLLMQNYIPLILGNPADGVMFHLFGMWMNHILVVSLLIGFVWRLSHALQNRESALIAAQGSLSQAQRLSALGGQAASIAHRLGTPTGTLTLLLDELQADPALAAHRPQLEVMGAQLEAIQRTLNTLRTQVDQAASRPPEPADLSLKHWLDLQLDEWRTLHPGQEVLAQTPPEAEGALVPVDHATLAVALATVLDNAAQAHQRAGAQASIRLVLGLRQGRWVIEVLDQGGGFPEALLPTLGHKPVPIEQFQVHGQGLGLYLMAQVLRARQVELELGNHNGGARVALHWPQGARA